MTDHPLDLLGDLRTIGSAVHGGVPDGDPATAWDRRKASYRLVSPLNRRKFTVIVVGAGLAGAGCAAALGELGFNVECFIYHDSPRRAHSIAAQGGINSPRARKVDNDSILRFVKDTVEGGDFRSREADCFRLGEESIRVIDHMNAIGAPFAREYGGQLATRSFGGVQVSRTYYTRGQTGQQLELAATQALHRQIAKGTVRLHTRHEMLDLIVKDGMASGIVARDMVTGEIRPSTAHAVVLATGGYGNVYYKSTLAKNSNATAAFRAHRRGAYFASPCFIQFHPTTLPINSPWQSKRMLMSESLRNDAREWVPTKKGDDRPPNDIPEDGRDYFLERRYPAFGNLVPRDVASRANALEIHDGHGVGPLHNGVYLDLRDAIARLGVGVINERYGNLLDMYHESTGEDPREVPMRIGPGAHFSMGGLWTDFDSMSNVPGLFVGGEASWAYHGANRLGANSLLSACVDGWFTLPVTVPSYLESLLGAEPLSLDDPAVTATVDEVKAGVGREVYQTSTMGALLQGVYDGEVAIRELLHHGDFGVGTFNRLDGEMVVLDGVCYQLLSDGSATIAEPEQKTPFAAVTRLHADHTLEVSAPCDRAAVKALIDGALESTNLMVAVRVVGEFGMIRTRTVTEQHQPYRPFTEATQDQQAVTFTDVTGTLAGFRMPEFEQGISVAGYHSHFIDEDHQHGGHALDYRLVDGTVEISVRSELHLSLQRTSEFLGADLTGRDIDGQIRQTEGS